LSDWIELSSEASEAALTYCEAVRAKVANAIAPDNRVDAALLEQEQRIVHGYAWIATTAQALIAARDWASRAQREGAFGEIEALVLRIGFGEYCAQIASGVAMSQNEVVRPSDFGLEGAANTFAQSKAVAAFLDKGNTAENRAALARRLGEGERPFEGFGDETLDLIRDQFRTFTADRITPNAHDWHLADDLIPFKVVEEMADLGV